MAETLYSPPRMPPANGRYPAIKTDWVMPDLGEPWPFQVTYLPNGWGVSVATIDPAMGERMLATNADNQRNQRPSVISRYASDMLSGRWLRTHQGVAFNCSGRLSDGQNRITAGIEAGAPFDTLVFFGIGADEEMIRFDSGIARTGVDAAKISGMEHIDHSDIATLRAFLNGPGHNTQAFTNSFYLEQIIRFRAMIMFSRTLPRAKYTQAPVRGVLARAFYHENPLSLSRFASVLTFDTPATEPGDKSAVALHKSMESHFGRGNKISQRDVYLRTQRSLRAYLDREDLSKLYAAEGDQFPMPTDDMIAAANAALDAK